MKRKCHFHCTDMWFCSQVLRVDCSIKYVLVATEYIMKMENFVCRKFITLFFFTFSDWSVQSIFFLIQFWWEFLCFTCITLYMTIRFYINMYSYLWLPWWLSGKESACQFRRHGFNPWVRKIPWRKKQQLTPLFLLGKSRGQRMLVSFSPWGPKSVSHDSVTKTTITFIFNYIDLSFDGRKQMYIDPV